MKIGIIREGKVPSDSRVVLTPRQCAFVRKQQDIELVVQSSPDRAFSDREYQAENVPVVDDISHCDLLLGVKEVPISQLIPGKTYFFFSHTIKKQEYNKGLLQTVLNRKIRLIDYELLTNPRGVRVIAFGYYAGMVGAHNGMWTFGRRTRKFDLSRMYRLRDYETAKTQYAQTDFPSMRIVVTGTGRVGQGAAAVLRDMGIVEVGVSEFLEDDHSRAVFVQIDAPDYVRHREGKEFTLQDYFDSPGEFQSDFGQFARRADLMINGIYWDERAPAFFTKAEMKAKDFRIRVIADVTCDIAPVSSIPSTLKASTIDDPIFGYDPNTGEMTAPLLPESIDMMTIDNLPNEMPRDASEGFGQQFIDHVLPALLSEGVESALIHGATIAADGELLEDYKYLEDWVRS